MTAIVYNIGEKMPYIISYIIFILFMLWYSPSGAYCYYMYDEQNRIMYEANTPPVDLSIVGTMEKYFPGWKLITITSQVSCENYIDRCKTAKNRIGVSSKATECVSLVRKLEILEAYDERLSKAEEQRLDKIKAEKEALIYQRIIDENKRVAEAKRIEEERKAERERIASTRYATEGEIARCVAVLKMINNYKDPESVRVENAMGEPEFVEFGNGDQGVLLYINAKNSYGAYAGPVLEVCRFQF